VTRIEENANGYRRVEAGSGRVCGCGVAMTRMILALGSRMSKRRWFEERFRSFV
jgi:hypothetical protein